MADKYLLRVTAGPTYDPSTHQIVSINQPLPTYITSPVCDVNITVRIQNYRGTSSLRRNLPKKRNPLSLFHTGLPRNSPNSSPYFTHAPHTHDQYSIAFTLVPHKSISGAALLFGNDFEKPIRDRLPPGFGTALKIVKWAIDPGLDGDVYCDKPYLYGNALSSLNVLSVADKTAEGLGIPAAPAGTQNEEALEEGGTEEGMEWREERGVPATADARKKWALQHGNVGDWVWEAGRVYGGDFFNPYLDFNGGDLVSLFFFAAEMKTNVEESC